MEKAGEYKEFLAIVKEQIQAAQVKTVIAANGQLLCLYWKLGNYILQNQSSKGWGAKVIDKLSEDIRKDFPLLKGFSARILGI